MNNELWNNYLYLYVDDTYCISVTTIKQVTFFFFFCFLPKVSNGLAISLHHLISSSSLHTRLCIHLVHNQLQNTCCNTTCLFTDFVLYTPCCCLHYYQELATNNCCLFLHRILLNFCLQRHSLFLSEMRRVGQSLSLLSNPLCVLHVSLVCGQCSHTKGF